LERGIAVRFAELKSYVRKLERDIPSAVKRKWRSRNPNLSLRPIDIKEQITIGGLFKDEQDP
jgi:hypothetical protein